MGALQRLALSREARGDEHLDVLHLFDIVRAQRAHGELERPHQVHRAIVFVRRAVQNIFQRPGNSHLDVETIWFASLPIDGVIETGRG